jgi:hypothetical protein
MDLKVENLKNLKNFEKNRRQVVARWPAAATVAAAEGLFFRN